MKAAALFLAFLSFIITIPTVEGHSNLRYPLSYHKHQCNARLGCAPCPRTLPSKKRNSVQRPAAKWKRGESVKISWHRNNHLDGFYRRTLVPVAAAFNLTAHNQLAFDWGCWAQGSFECTTKHCGGDKHQLAFSGPMTVPHVFPDGDYMFVQTWFGGSDRSMNPEIPKAQFSNFAACSHVRIQGGINPQEESRKVFTQGNQENERSFEDDNSEGDGELKPTQCWSTATRVNECAGGTACNGTLLKAMTPDVFADGKKPILTRMAVERVFKAYSSPTITPTPSRAFTSPLPEDSKAESRNNIMSQRKGIPIHTELSETSSSSPSLPTLKYTALFTFVSSPSPSTSISITPQPSLFTTITQLPTPLPSITSIPGIPPIEATELNSRSASSIPSTLASVTNEPPSVPIPSSSPSALLSPISSSNYSASPSITPVVSSSPSASTIPTLTPSFTAKPSFGPIEPMSPSPSLTPVLTPSSSTKPSVTAVESTSPSVSKTPVSTPSSTVNPSVTAKSFRDTLETSVPLPSETNDGSGQNSGRTDFSIVTVDSSQGPLEPHRQRTQSPSVSNMGYPSIFGKGFPVVTGPALPQPSSSPSPTVSVGGGMKTLWGSAESRWRKQCGMYRACIEYCELHPVECSAPI